MKINHSALIGAIILVTTFSSTESRGQVDEVWLRSWNEAEASRPATIASKGRIAAASEDGMPLIIHGRVVAPDGSSAGGVLVHAYHRDKDGFEFGPNDNAVTTWKLQGWVRTDASGRFEFRTIRPAPDHLGREGSHIHFTLDSADFGRQWAPKVFFSDDPLVPTHQHQRSEKAGEFGWIREIRIVDGIQHVDVKFQLKGQADF